MAEPGLRASFESFVRDKNFPCVGAKSALAHGTLKTVVCWSIESAWDDVRIHRELLAWAFENRENPGLFRSIAFIFAQSGPNSEQQFEEAMWQRIQSLSNKDAWLGQPYDSRVSSDPDSPHFSLSFGGEGFFVVGMHPEASRPARRFERPVMVFNLHDQFEQLRAQGKYETIREVILQRDQKLAGSINPMLARHGDASEAAQYSGRFVAADWRCPFSEGRRGLESADRETMRAGQTFRTLEHMAGQCTLSAAVPTPSKSLVLAQKQDPSAQMCTAPSQIVAVRPSQQDGVNSAGQRHEDD